MTEQQPKRKFAQKRDLLIMLAILLIAAGAYLAKVVFFDSGTTAVAQIYSDSVVVQTVELRPGYSEKITVPGKPNVVLLVSDGKIRFESSDCPDKICIKSGWLSRPGESAACLPNKVAVKIVAARSTKPGGADIYIS